MRKTADEIVAMGREGFIDAMFAELEAKAQRPGLSPEERERLQHEVEKVRAQLAARRERQAAEKRAA